MQLAALETTPRRDPQLLRLLASNARYGLRQISEAAQWYQQLEALDPQFDVLINYGTLLQQSGTCLDVGLRRNDPMLQEIQWLV